MMGGDCMWWQTMAIHEYTLLFVDDWIIYVYVSIFNINVKNDNNGYVVWQLYIWNVK